MFVNHLGDCVAKQNDVLVKGLDLALQLDPVDQIDRHGHMLPAKLVEERVLQKLAFVIAHDMLRVQIERVDRTRTIPQAVTRCTADTGFRSLRKGCAMS